MHKFQRHYTSCRLHHPINRIINFNALSSLMGYGKRAQTKRWFCIPRQLTMIRDQKKDGKRAQSSVQTQVQVGAGVGRQLVSISGILAVVGSGRGLGHLLIAPIPSHHTRPCFVIRRHQLLMRCDGRARLPFFSPPSFEATSSSTSSLTINTPYSLTLASNASPI